MTGSTVVPRQFHGGYHGGSTVVPRWLPQHGALVAPQLPPNKPRCCIGLGRFHRLSGELPAPSPATTMPHRYREQTMAIGVISYLMGFISMAITASAHPSRELQANSDKSSGDTTCQPSLELCWPLITHHYKPLSTIPKRDTP